MTFFEFVKDLILTEFQKTKKRKNENLGKIEFYRPVTIGRAPQSPK